MNREFKGKSLIEFPKDYIVIDIETTGLLPYCDEIIEVAAIKIKNNKIIDTFESLVKPELEIDKFVEELTGITNEDLKSAPSIIDVLPSYLDFIGDNILIGHNINFDINFLYDNSIDVLNKPLNNNFVDTLRIARKLLKNLEHHRLDDLCDFYNIEKRNLHRSLNDCLLTQKIYLSLIEDISNIEVFKDSFKRKNFSKAIKAKDIISDFSEVDKDNYIYKKFCVITGKLEKMTRKEAMQVIANIGGHNQDSITKKTNYLILGNNDYCKTIKDGKSSKQKKAEAYKLKGQDIEIIPEDVFYELIHI